VVDHQEVLSRVAVVRDGALAGHVQKLDRESTGRSHAVFFKRALSVGEPDDGVKEAAWFLEHAVPQACRYRVGDAELRGDAARGLGMLGAPEASVYSLYLGGCQFSHLLEDVRVVQFWILAIQFPIHGITPLRARDRRVYLGRFRAGGGSLWAVQVVVKRRCRTTRAMS